LQRIVQKPGAFVSGMQVSPGGQTPASQGSPMAACADETQVPKTTAQVPKNRTMLSMRTLEAVDASAPAYSRMRA
jgi:hypothetical protein